MKVFARLLGPKYRIILVTSSSIFVSDVQYQIYEFWIVTSCNTNLVPHKYFESSKINGYRAKCNVWNRLSCFWQCRLQNTSFYHPRSHTIIFRISLIYKRFPILTNIHFSYFYKIMTYLHWNQPTTKMYLEGTFCFVIRGFFYEQFEKLIF